METDHQRHKRDRLSAAFGLVGVTLFFLSYHHVGPDWLHLALLLDRKVHSGIDAIFACITFFALFYGIAAALQHFLDPYSYNDPED